MVLGFQEKEKRGVCEAHDFRSNAGAALAKRRQPFRFGVEVSAQTRADKDSEGFAMGGAFAWSGVLPSFRLAE